MTLHDLREWLGILNLLLVPLFAYVIRIERAVVEERARSVAHDELDRERFAALGARVERLEERADAA